MMSVLSLLFCDVSVGRQDSEANRCCSTCPVCFVKNMKVCASGSWGCLAVFTGQGLFKMSMMTSGAPLGVASWLIAVSVRVCVPGLLVFHFWGM